MVLPAVPKAPQADKPVGSGKVSNGFVVGQSQPGSSVGFRSQGKLASSSQPQPPCTTRQALESQRPAAQVGEGGAKKGAAQDGDGAARKVAVQVGNGAARKVAAQVGDAAATKGLPGGLPVLQEKAVRQNRGSAPTEEKPRVWAAGPSCIICSKVWRI